MRSVEELKETRDRLDEEYRNFAKIKNQKFPTPDVIKNLNVWERHEYNYVMRSATNLLLQINAISFVLNEDCDLRDASRSSRSESVNGITKEELFKALNE